MQFIERPLSPAEHLAQAGTRCGRDERYRNALGVERRLVWAIGIAHQAFDFPLEDAPVLSAAIEFEGYTDLSAVVAEVHPPVGNYGELGVGHIYVDPRALQLALRAELRDRHAELASFHLLGEDQQVIGFQGVLEEQPLALRL